MVETVTGYVGHIVFRNEENGYTVFHLENDDGEVTCVGNFNFINEGEMLELTGEYVNHNVYGTQLKVSSHVVKEPEDLVSIERYLGSGAVKGVGAALAGRIVKKFKEDTFRIIEEEPERLAEVKGISERKAREIAEQVEEKKDMRKAMIYLQKYGISTRLAAKIYQYYGMRVYKVLEENPYQLADNIEGVGFKTADEIAARIGIHTDSDYRIKSGLFYTLQQAVGEGHIYLPEEVLVRRAGELLGVEIQDVSTHVMDLCIEKKTVMKEGEDGIRIYPAHYYYLELNTAKMLHDLNIDCEMPEDMMERRLRKVEETEQIELDEMQHKAVIESIKHGLLVLTGGPGTGKTTTINTMIRFFDSEGMSILLAAPTGRAAKRMTEATGYEAQTIHRLLEVNVNPEETDSVGGFMRNRQNPLEADVIIIDEMSMVDLPLMHALLSAVVPGTRLVLVGDVDQLPSVGPGSVLKDIITSGCFPVVTLTRIFRQAGESDIVVNAHKINAGEPVVLDNKSRDFFFLRRRRFLPRDRFLFFGRFRELFLFRRRGRFDDFAERGFVDFFLLGRRLLLRLGFFVGREDFRGGRKLFRRVFLSFSGFRDGDEVREVHADACGNGFGGKFRFKIRGVRIERFSGSEGERSREQAQTRQRGARVADAVGVLSAFFQP